MKKLLTVIIASIALVLGVSSPAMAAKPSNPDIQIVYEYQTPTEPPEPGTFAVVNYTADDYWLCVKWTSGGVDHSYSFFLDEYADPGHERTGSVAVDPGTVINLYMAVFTPDEYTGRVDCTKQRIDTYRVPR